MTLFTAVLWRNLALTKQTSHNKREAKRKNGVRTPRSRSTLPQPPQTSRDLNRMRRPSDVPAKRRQRVPESTKEENGANASREELCWFCPAGSFFSNIMHNWSIEEGHCDS